MFINTLFGHLLLKHIKGFFLYFIGIPTKLKQYLKKTRLLIILSLSLKRIYYLLCNTCFVERSAKHVIKKNALYHNQKHQHSSTILL